MITTAVVSPKTQSANYQTHASTGTVPKSYNPDQQLKYLHLQAEVEVLLQQLQTLKLKRNSGVAEEN